MQRPPPRAACDGSAPDCVLLLPLSPAASSHVPARLLPDCGPRRYRDIMTVVGNWPTDCFGQIISEAAHERREDGSRPEDPGDQAAAQVDMARDRRTAGLLAHLDLRGLPRTDVHDRGDRE